MAFAMRAKRRDCTSILGVALEPRVDDNARLNRFGEFVKQTRASVLKQQVVMRSTIDNPYRAQVPYMLQISGQPRLAAWAQENICGPRFAARIYQSLIVAFCIG